MQDTENQVGRNKKQGFNLKKKKKKRKKKKKMINPSNRQGQKQGKKSFKKLKYIGCD